MRWPTLPCLALLRSGAATWAAPRLHPVLPPTLQTVLLMTLLAVALDAADDLYFALLSVLTQRDYLNSLRSDLLPDCHPQAGVVQ